MNSSIPSGTIETGIIAKYDETTMTAVIQSNYGIIHNVVCLFERYDPKNGAYSFRAPSEGALCLYTTIDGTTYLLGLYSPINYTQDGMHPTNSSCRNTQNRTPSDMANSIVKPGNVIDTNSNGSSDSFTDTEKRTVISPGKLESLWNLLNFIWENTCQIFRLFSGPLDITAEVNEELDDDDETINNCNTTVKVRRTLDERPDGSTTMIDLRMGNDADIIDLKINGENFLHIDGDRNITLIARKIDINAEQINYNVTGNEDYEGHNGEVNMLNVSTVRLP